MLFILKTLLIFVFFIFQVFHLGISIEIKSLKSDNQTQEIIREILNNRFASAEEILLKTSNYTVKIPTIVREIYNGSENNMNLILKCVKGMNKIDISFSVLKSLRNLMKTHGHLNPLNLMEFVYTLESEILHQKNGNSSKPGAKILVDEIIADIDVNTLKILKAAMLAQHYRNNPEVQNLTNNIYHFRSNLSDSIMRRLVNETFGRIPSAQMADNIFYGSMKIPQIIMGLLTLFDKLESTNSMNDEAVIQVAKNIKMLRDMINYRRLPKKKKIAVNKLIEKLPVCAKNLYFAQHLCIWNRGKDEYVYASDGQFYFTRRSVFTCSLNDITNDGIWKVEVFDDRFYFRSLAHNKEYLYASTTDRHGSANSRLVETWMDVGFLGTTSGWNIELDGDYCYIRNENFNEFMFVANEKIGERRRLVFTSKSKGTSEDTINFQWQIRNCG